MPQSPLRRGSTQNEQPGPASPATGHRARQPSLGDVSKACDASSDR